MLADNIAVSVAIEASAAVVAQLAKDMEGCVEVGVDAVGWYVGWVCSTTAWLAGTRACDCPLWGGWGSEGCVAPCQETEGHAGQEGFGSLQPLGWSPSSGSSSGSLLLLLLNIEAERPLLDLLLSSLFFFCFLI